MARPQRITDDTILDALASLGEATSEELAAQMGIGQSTAAKRLAALESAGLTRRQPGGRVNGVRAADRWAATAAAGDAGAGKLAPDPDGVEAIGHEANDGDDESPASEEEPDDAAAAEETEVSGDRLGRGALGSLVRDYLAARPDDDLGPTQVGTALGRSQGAVANALARLEAAGEAKLVSASPRRYRFAADRLQQAAAC